MALRFFTTPHISFLLQLTSFATSTLQATTSSTPNLRIEAPHKTLFEGPITSGPRNLTAVVSDAGGLTFACDGVEGGANGPNATPFNTALDALDQASKTFPGFNYTLGYDGDMTDFYILTLAGIGGGDPYEQWNLLWNWKVPDYGNGDHISGCRQQVHTGDDVLWAAVVEDKTPVYLKVTPSTKTVKKGQSVTFTVTDGLTGNVQPLATINGVKANSKGQVKVRYPKSGHFSFKAKETGAVRSPLVKVTVKG